MSNRGSGSGGGRGNRSKKPGETPDQPSAAARRKQIIVGLVMGALVGGLLWWLADFWMWFPAGLVMGLSTGALMKPPAG